MNTNKGSQLMIIQQKITQQRCGMKAFYLALMFFMGSIPHIFAAMPDLVVLDPEVSNPGVSNPGVSDPEVPQPVRSGGFFNRIANSELGKTLVAGANAAAKVTEKAVYAASDTAGAVLKRITDGEAEQIARALDAFEETRIMIEKDVEYVSDFNWGTRRREIRRYNGKPQIKEGSLPDGTWGNKIVHRSQATKDSLLEIAKQQRDAAIKAATANAEEARALTKSMTRILPDAARLAMEQSIKKELVLEEAKIKAKAEGKSNQAMLDAKLKFLNDFLNDKKKLASVVAVVAGSALAIYGIKMGTNVLGKYLEAKIGKPTLVRETSRA
ncbi:MAG: AAA domain-containing protein, partial [Candidatus Paceibacterales bacterium]